MILDLSNHTHHNSLFVVLEWLCVLVVNSRIGLWGLWVGGALKGVESKVIVVPWVSSCMGFVPKGSSMSSRAYKSHTP